MEKSESFVQTLLILTALFSVVALFVIVYVLYFNRRKRRLLIEQNQMRQGYERALLQSQIEVQEATFNSLAQELHDNVGQLLGTTRMLLGITERSLQTAPDTLLTANETLGQAIQELRTLSKSLSREWLGQFDLIENLRTELRRLNTGEGLQASLEVPSQLHIDAGRQILLFRVLQEAIQNTVRHAGARQLRLSIQEEKAQLALWVEDDGCGIPEAKQESLGLRNMRQRVQLLGGTIAWTPAAGGGTRVSIVIPVTSAVGGG